MPFVSFREVFESFQTVSSCLKDVVERFENVRFYAGGNMRGAQCGIRKGVPNTTAANCGTTIHWNGAFNETLRARLNELEQRKAELKAALTAAVDSAPSAVLHPASAEVYKSQVAELEAALNDPEFKTEASEILRNLIERVALTPDAYGTHVRLGGALAWVRGHWAYSAGRGSYKALI